LGDEGGSEVQEDRYKDVLVSREGTTPGKESVESSLEQRPRTMQEQLSRATATLAPPCATWHLGIHARRMAHDSRDGGGRIASGTAIELPRTRRSGLSKLFFKYCEYRL